MTISLMQYIYIAFVLTYCIFYYFALELGPCSLEITKDNFEIKLDGCVIFRYIYTNNNFRLGIFKIYNTRIS
jgi:uncharacterized protein YwgA